MTRRIGRRAFIQVGAAAAASAVLAGCKFPRRWVQLESFVRAPEQQVPGTGTWYASACGQCPAGCGIIVRVVNGRAVKIEGNPEHPINQGKLCPLGQAGLQLLYNPDRVARPMRQSQRGSRQFEALGSWDEALALLTQQLQGAPAGLAVWLGGTVSGHLVDLFTRFTAALGAPAPFIFDLPGLLDGRQTLTAASQTIFGTAALPTYDLSNADIVFSFGDFLGEGLSRTRYGIAFGHFREQPGGQRGFLAQFEPRMSLTGAAADRWLPITPGTEGLVAQALARLMAAPGVGPADRAARAATVAGTVDVNSVAQASGISVEDLGQLARAFVNAARPLAIASGAVIGQGSTGGLASVLALNSIAGNLGQPGGVQLSTAPLPAGIVAPAFGTLADLQSLLERMRAGQVQTLLVLGTNPVYELPPQFGVTDALGRVPFIVSFSPVLDETSTLADLLLPARTYLESWGYRVVSPSFGQPIITSQQPVVSTVLGIDARAPADVLLAASKSIPAAAGALTWNDEAAFLQQVLGVLPAAAYDTDATTTPQPAERVARFQQHGGWWPAAPAAGTSAATAAAPATAPAITVAPVSFQGDATQFPYFLHLYRPTLLDDGRGANLPWLQGSPDPLTSISWQSWVELNPETAHELGVTYGDIVQVTSSYGQVEVPVYVYPAIRPDTIAMPLGQGHTNYGRYASARGSNALHLLGAQADPAGTGLAWSTVRVNVTRTGRRMALPLFENVEGAREGFINKSFLLQ